MTCPECGSDRDTERHDPACMWVQDIAEDRAADLRMWGE